MLAYPVRSADALREKLSEAGDRLSEAPQTSHNGSETASSPHASLAGVLDRCRPAPKSTRLTAE